jgi:protein-S-isoprenylcysteine O-methyltransferase Ste14
VGLKRKWRRLSDAKKKNIANTVVAVLAVLVLAAVAYAMMS